MEFTRDDAKSMIRQYNDTVDQLRTTPTTHNRKREELRLKLVTLAEELEKHEVVYERTTVAGWVHLILVPTPEEKAERAATLRQWAIADQKKNQAQDVEQYRYRLQEMIRHCESELAGLNAGELQHLQTSFWASTSALDLPRLQERIKTREATIRAFELE